MVSAFIVGFLGGVFTNLGLIGLQVAATKYLQKKYKKVSFNKGDYVRTKETTKQPWEDEEPPTVTGQVLEVGQGVYLMELTAPGYSPQQVTLGFSEVHLAFEKDSTRRAKPKLGVVH
jgi:hypothetical protein